MKEIERYKDKEKRLEYIKKWQKEHPEKIKQAQQKYDELHHEKRLEQYRQSHKKHRAERAIKDKEYREKHKEHYKEIYHKYQIEHGKEQTRRYYENHIVERKELSRKNSKELTKWMDEIKKDMGCAICGYNKYGYILDFHHVNGEKEINGTQIRFMYHGKQRYFDEMEKCILLCSVCHKIVHHQERHYDDPEWAKEYNEYISSF